MFRALYWLGKEELPNSKITSLLTLLEKMGLEEIKQFRTRSEPVLREMMLVLAQTIQEDLVQKISQSGEFGLLTDEVTDISNMQQLITFIKYFRRSRGYIS